jgi:hypothetical protein
MDGEYKRWIGWVPERLITLMIGRRVRWGASEICRHELQNHS